MHEEYRMVDLESFRWNNRLVLVFGPTAEDAAVMQQRAWLDEQARGTGERDLVVGYIFAFGPSTLGKETVSPDDVARLLDRFDIRPDTFKFVLVGKDGGVKRTATEPVDVNDLFAQIDAMPMRQIEMQQQGER
jgi:hypothetical protein